MKNAKITSTRLGPEDHGVFTAYIFLEGHGFGGGFGGYVLGEHVESWVMGVLRCAGVDKWEDLPGKLIRVDDPVLGDQFKRIAHVTDSIYFDATEWSDQAIEESEAKTRQEESGASIDLGPPEQERAPLWYGGTPVASVTLGAVNQALDASGLTLVVSTWDGEGERTPTRLVLVRGVDDAYRVGAESGPAAEEGPQQPAKQPARTTSIQDLDDLCREFLADHEDAQLRAEALRVLATIVLG